MRARAGGQARAGGVAIATVLLLALLAAPATAAEPVEGEWVTAEAKARVRIARCAGATETWCGVITWLAEPLDETGRPKTDKRNPDAAMHSRPIVGLPLLQGFRKTGPSSYGEGTIYDPEGGRTYRSKMNLAGPDTLEVAGCVLFFCREQTWRRWRP